MVIMSLSSCFPTHYALVSQILSESHPMSALYCPFSNSGHHSAISLSILAESSQIKGLPFLFFSTFPPCRIVSVLQAGGRLVHGGNVDCVIIITVVVACWANKLRTHNAAHGALAPAQHLLGFRHLYSLIMLSVTTFCSF